MADPRYTDRHPYQQSRFIVTAYDAAAYAAAAAARDVAKVAQMQMIADMGNPFKERAGR